MTVRFVDLRAQHDEVRPELDRLWKRVVDNSEFIGGALVEEFERDFSEYCGARHAVATGNGTDALELALRAVGVGPGDIVVTVPNTFIATAEAPIVLGAEVRFVDIDPVTRNMAPAQLDGFLSEKCAREDDGRTIERSTGRRLAAIVPVHLYGLPAPMEAIQHIGAAWGVPVVEDACQAHGAGYRRSDGTFMPVGRGSAAACFSFYPGKNLGALGEGGALVTDDDGIATETRVLRDHGQSERYSHMTDRGRNARLDALQAGALSIKLKRLPEWNERRRTLADQYRELLSGSQARIPIEPPGAMHVYHLYVVEVAGRDGVRERLAGRSVETGLHYPVPLHLQPAFAHLNMRPGSFPAAEAQAAAALSMPMHPHLVFDQLELAASELLAALPRA